MFALVDNVLGHVSSLVLFAPPLALLQARVDLHQHLQHIALRSLASLRREGRGGESGGGEPWKQALVLLTCMRALRQCFGACLQKTYSLQAPLTLSSCVASFLLSTLSTGQSHSVVRPLPAPASQLRRHPSCNLPM